MKIAHPEPAFREAAEEACRSIGTAVEKYVLSLFVTVWGDGPCAAVRGACPRPAGEGRCVLPRASVRAGGKGEGPQRAGTAGWLPVLLLVDVLGHLVTL